jgi:hypothetical protein
MAGAIHLVEGGNITGMSTLMSEDIRRADEQEKSEQGNYTGESHA